MGKTVISFFAALSLSLAQQSYAAQTIECASGWLNERTLKKISPEQINDGYCDCPLDGLDEPETGACAGSMDGGWSGVKPSINVNASPTGHFQCPQQKSLLLPLSRINDGICDCCDGADEPPSSNCNDSCDELLREELAARAKIAVAFAEGARRRQKEIVAYQQILKETLEEIEEISVETIPATKKHLEVVEKNMDATKQFYARKRLKAAKEVGASFASGGGSNAGLFETMTLVDILHFIVSSCQLAGELADADTLLPDWKRQTMTCVPLRLAGLDNGIVWENENFAEGNAAVKFLKEDDDKALLELGNLLRQTQVDGAGLSTLSSPSSLRKKSSRTPVREQERMLNHDDEHDYDDYDHYEDYHYDLMDDSEDPDEAFERLTRENKRKQNNRVKENNQNDQSVADVNESVFSTVKAMPFYLPRASFKPHAEALLSSIDDMLKLEEHDESDEDEEKDDTTNQPDTDPIAAQMVRGTLSRRLSHIERGEHFASSAIILLDALELAMERQGENQESALLTLKQLAVGTLNYGGIGSEDVAEILFALIPEYKMGGVDDQVCAPYFASMCPPRSHTVKLSDGSTGTYPPNFILSAAEARCKQRDLSSLVCSDGGSSDQNDIPNSVPDGYYNYFVHQSRSEDDHLSESFKPLDLAMQITNLEEQQVARENELRGYEDRLRNLEEKIGGGDSTKYGTDGELYGIQNECAALEAGKYEYKICFFKGATQTEKGGHGTDLGKWDGMETDEETGERIMKWNDGAKCWNGPKRSVEAHVSCGKETNILTADEPDTCRYVLTMESHIACDDKFKSQHGL